jgi:hypothetical protein
MWARSVEPQSLPEDEISLPQILVRTIEADRGPGDRDATDAAVEILLELAHDHARWELPESWLLATASALRENDWSLLTEGFKKEEFLGATGQLLIVAPYTVNREGCISSVLSAVYGSVMPHQDLPDLDAAVQEMFHELTQPVTRILPILCDASCGHLGTEAGEAFIVPDGWEIPGSVEGPALNDMREQRRRFVESGSTCIRRIFDPATADLLLDVYRTPAEQMTVQHVEYQFHEAGHAAGVGLTRKFNDHLMPTWWHGAVEEWRSDGVAFELAGRMIGEERAGKLIASNFCTRFGVDAHRRGGADRDRDVAASLLSLDSALRPGGLHVENGKLALRDASFRGLFRATESHRLNAVRLTRDEMAPGHGVQDDGIRDKYRAIQIEPQSRLIFDDVVRGTCAGVYRELR